MPDNNELSPNEVQDSSSPAIRCSTHYRAPSMAPQRDPLTEATVDLALRILEGSRLNKRRVEVIVNHYYKGASPKVAFFRAYKLAVDVQPEWPSLADSTNRATGRAVARVRSSERSMGYAERAQQHYDNLSQEFKAKYLKGTPDEHLGTVSRRWQMAKHLQCSLGEQWDSNSFFEKMAQPTSLAPKKTSKDTLAFLPFAVPAYKKLKSTIIATCRRIYSKLPTKIEINIIHEVNKNDQEE